MDEETQEIVLNAIRELEQRLKDLEFTVEELGRRVNYIDNHME